jgi:hypothetical protein
MSDLWNNDYSAAGPGHKRRERQTLKSIPRTMEKSKPKRPDVERHRLKKPAQHEAPMMTGRNLRQKIIQLTLQIGSFGAIVDRLEQEQYGPASKVLVSNVRDHAMTVLRVIMDEGLISQKALNRYRKDAKEAQRKRFKRERLDDDD